MAQPAPSCSPGAQQVELGCCSDTEMLLRISKSPLEQSRVSSLSAQPCQNYCQVQEAAPKFPARLSASQSPAQLPPDGRASFPTRSHILKNVLLSSGLEDAKHL